MGLKVICYDIVGLDESYRALLVSKNFQPALESADTKAIELDGLGSVRNVANYSSADNNMEFQFIRGPLIPRRVINIQMLTDAISQLAGSRVDAAVSMFGSISHIMKHENREGIFRMINEINSGYFASTLPTRNIHEADLERAQIHRREHANTRLEEGDAKYRAADDGKRYFYHHYDRAELTRELRAAGFADCDIKPSAFRSPLECLRDDGVDALDAREVAEALTNMTQEEVDRKTSYFAVSAKCRGRSPAPAPALQAATAAFVADKVRS